MYVDDFDVPLDKVSDVPRRVIERAIDDDATRRRQSEVVNEHLLRALASLEWALFSETMRTLSLNPHAVLQPIEVALQELPGIDEVVLFDPLSSENVDEIAQQQLATLASTLARSGKTLHVDDDALALIAHRGYSLAYGASGRATATLSSRSRSRAPLLSNMTWCVLSEAVEWSYAR